MLECLGTSVSSGTEAFLKGLMMNKLYKQPFAYFIVPCGPNNPSSSRKSFQVQMNRPFLIAYS